MNFDLARLEDPALARKHRMELRAMQLGEESDEASSSKRQRLDDDDEDSYEEEGSTFGERKPSVRGIKKQARYIPGVPMNKEELATWRKEARRVRNRESAAESRRKTRDRIDELESQVQGLQSKYAVAVNRIMELETTAASSGSDHHDSFTPDHMRQDLMNSRSVVSATPSPELSSEGGMPLPPIGESFYLDGDFQSSSHQEYVSQKHQHIMNMIPRPTAAWSAITL
jgi:hypothetical protein